MAEENAETGENTENGESVQAVAEPEEMCYISEKAPQFRIGKKIRFDKGIFRTSDPAVIEELDMLLATRRDISSQVRKVDPAEARALAEKRIAQMRAAGVRGMFTSADMRERTHAVLDDRDAQLKAQGLQPHDLDTDEIKAGDLALSQRAAPTSVPKEGFKPTPQSEPGKPVTEAGKRIMELKQKGKGE